MSKTLIEESLLKYILEKSDLNNISEIPKDESLLYNGILDSFGIIELVEFIESNWSISIDDDDFTLEKMGSVNKMVYLIASKTSNSNVN